jgi:hypothetical protein
MDLDLTIPSGYHKKNRSPEAFFYQKFGLMSCFGLQKFWKEVAVDK